MNDEVRTKLDAIHEIISSMNDRDAKWTIIAMALGLRLVLMGEGLQREVANERIIAGMDSLDINVPLGTVQ